MNAPLLIIADTGTANFISQALQPDCWTVHMAELGSDSLNAVVRLKPASIILDARRTNQSYAEFCCTIRSMEDMAAVPLVALVKPGQSDTVDLLEAGADDCWVDSIESRELQVRLMGIHRRLHSSRATRLVRYGGVDLDLDRYTVRASGPPVKLTVKQVKVLELLMENAGIVVPRRELLERIWGDADLDGGVVRTFIKRLRQVLSATGAVNVIRYASGGYVFETETAPLQVPRQGDHDFASGQGQEADRPH